MRRLTILILVLCWLLPQQPAVSDVIKGGVTHSESLPPVEPTLRSGSQFDEKFIPKPSKSIWFRVPKWIAGNWRRSQTITQVNGKPPVSRKDIRIRRYGFQADKQGRIWHWVRTPFPNTTEIPEGHCCFLVRQEEPISITRDRVVVRMIWTAWLYNHMNIVVSVVQGDQTDTFVEVEPGVIKAESAIAHYDQNGKLVSTGRATWLDYRIEDFASIDQYEGKNLKSLFVDFLGSQGMFDRIPEGAGVASGEMR